MTEFLTRQVFAPAVSRNNIVGAAGNLVVVAAISTTDTAVLVAISTTATAAVVVVANSTTATAVVVAISTTASVFLDDHFCSYCIFATVVVSMH